MRDDELVTFIYRLHRSIAENNRQRKREKKKDRMRSSGALGDRREYEVGCTHDYYIRR